MTRAKERVAIIGAGLMGHGLAAVFANGGYPVAITDEFPDVLAAAKDRIEGTLASIGWDAAALARITPRASLKDAVADADIVIEAVPEKLALKQAIFARLEAAAPPAALLCSNTSVIPIGQIAAGLATRSRVLGTHWWNPPYLVPLVEVIEAEGTDPAHVARMMVRLRGLGKVAVHVKKDVPGFVGNRMQHALWREAIALVDAGVCDAETIDLVVKNSFGRRLAVLGPMENADLVGTDLTLDIQNSVLPHLDRSVEPTGTLRSLVAEGKLGFKSSAGFKTWTPEQKAELRARVTEHLKLLNEILKI